MILLKKENKLTNEFVQRSNFTSKGNRLKKSLQNQSFLFNYDNELETNTWTKNHEDMSQISNTSERKEKKTKTNKRQQSKNRFVDRSKFMLFNLKERNDHQTYTVDSSRCIFRDFNI